MQHNEIIERSNPHAKVFILGVLAILLLLMVVYLTPWLSPMRVPFAYLIPLLLAGSLIPMAALNRLGGGKAPSLPLVIGIFSLVGGAAFDMIVTVLKSPTLDMEANPIARSLLDSGHSVSFVYVYAITAQVILVVLGCIMWTAFLRHYSTWTASARNARPKSYFDFVKAIHGGEDLSWRQYILPLKLSELPKSYHVALAFAVIWTGLSPYRWYFGLEWLGWFPGLRIHMLVAWTAVFGIGYAIWLWMIYRTGPKKQ